jgi:osmotically inducible lipoprotein OsmB
VKFNKQVPGSVPKRVRDVGTVLIERGYSMKMTQGLSLGIVVSAMILGLSACSGMSSRDKNTAIGAGAGALGGAILTGGGTAGTIGGAVVGGVIGHEVGKK